MDNFEALFKTLNPGTYFVYEGKLYLKIVTKPSWNVNAIQLASGYPVKVHDDLKIIVSSIDIISK